MIQGSLEVLAAYLIIFLPLLALVLLNQGMLFIAYGGLIAVLSFMIPLIRQIQADLKDRRQNRKRG